MINFLLQHLWVPDFLIRRRIRRLLTARLHEEGRLDSATREQREQLFATQLRDMPVAINTKDSKQQHYEVPTAFYQHVLGSRLKYSCAWFDADNESLDRAELAMLKLYAERAKLEDGQTILELGCGWGSLSLWMAERYPNSQVLGVSHSKTQKEFIDGEAKRRGLTNLRIQTCDMNDFVPPTHTFDRVVSVEMFEHMKNWPLLLTRIEHSLKSGGLFFLHIFTHERFSYHFIVRDHTDWMSQHFFTGGMMPAASLLSRFQDRLHLRETWTVSGKHYQRTAECWLRNMDASRAQLRPVFHQTYGADAALWWSYWRIFFMSCAELWGWRDGKEWTVSHYLMAKP